MSTMMQCTRIPRAHRASLPKVVLPEPDLDSDKVLPHNLQWNLKSFAFCLYNSSVHTSKSSAAVNSYSTFISASLTLLHHIIRGFVQNVELGSERSQSGIQFVGEESEPELVFRVSVNHLASESRGSKHV